MHLKITKIPEKFPEHRMRILFSLNNVWSLRWL